MSEEKCPIAETCVHYNEGCFYLACCAREEIARLRTDNAAKDELIFAYDQTHTPVIDKTIIDLRADLAKLNLILFHRENGLSHPDLKGEIAKSKMAHDLADALEALKSIVVCPDWNICPHCGIEMGDGQALLDELDGYPDFVGNDTLCTISPSGKAKLIECLKCPDCGFSRTKKEALKAEEE